MGITRTGRHLLPRRGGIDRLLATVRWRTLARAGAAAALVAGTLAGATATAATAGAATSGPCDIYAAGSTPCVAAHSTTRALYASYKGPLYQVRRASDNTTRNIGVLEAGGYVDAAAQDAFCAGTTCLITIIYDQSGRANNLTQAPGGGGRGGPAHHAKATPPPPPGGRDKAKRGYEAPPTGDPH
ncbi:arabinofuranosidase catalytic domain-containing protein, partial [Streptomyces mirabilis]